MTAFDFVVVGSGAAGAAAAWKLTGQGFKVALLDRGDWVDPARYPSTGPDWERAKRRHAHPSIAERQGPADYPIDDSASPIAICNYNAIGGSTILYSGHFPRFRPVDFELASREGVGADWPIDYQTLRPYFEENEREMSAAGLAGDPKYPDIQDLLPPVPLGQAGTQLARAFNAKGWHWWPSYSAISTRAVRGRDACINLGPCNTGCPQGAKSSTDVTYIAKAQAKGLTVLPNHAVARVLIENGRAVGVLAHDADGTARQIAARAVVLAASAMGTSRILLNSTGADAPNGLANRSDQVGRNLMIHPLGYVEGVFPGALDTHIGPQGCMLYSLEHDRSPEADHHLGYMMHVLRGTGPVETAIAAYQRRKLRFGPALHEDFDAFWRKQLVVSLICEDLPDPENRVTLDADRADRFGVPGLRVSYRLSENCKKMMVHGMARAKEVLVEAGARRTYAAGPVRNTGWHVMGTARMGTDPDTSVVGPDGQAHDVAGLYVVDSSVFVTGSCVNPANTIQAVALCLADRMAQSAKLEGAA
ncbi:GMC family oxidoreductase [Ruegeria arenilitoris]|uniref:GMC family oxidoreductase n=1 Tax=Ruegeria arenilitoris TaxID=1173585 RepID=UPI001C984AD8|nr:GMC family oxidoreductase [Ruegeria arenilitoris]MBY6081855.1 GMC family oxidoreductase [Ruegeria arenilitoris]